ncbi:MAG: GapR family DNA-binding domain-containing protein [Alphaproteobacteria bacterium]
MSEFAGHNQTVAGEPLREIIKRLGRIDDEIAELAEEKSQVRQMAKRAGFDVRIINIVMQRSRQDRETVAETDQLVEMYERALKAVEGGA